MPQNFNVVTCNICGQPYTLPEDEVLGNLPHVLLCSHIFCTSCLRSLETPQNIIACPECKMETTVGEDGVEGLQVDSRIIGLIYTTKMNIKKRQARGTRSNELPLGLAVEKDAELDEALSQAVENLAQLNTLQQTLVNGMQVQVRKEKSRLLKEIDEATERAVGILYRRRSMLVSELNGIDQTFTLSRQVCERVQERQKELQTSIQKARHVRQVPSLENYCELDKVLETLQSPVDVQSYDLSCLSLGSGLSLSAEGSASQPGQPHGSSRHAQRSRGTEERRARGPRHREGSFSQQRQTQEGRRQESRRQDRQAGRSSTPPQTDCHSPSVIIEEIIEETDMGTQRAPLKQPERQRQQRKNHRNLLDKPPVRKSKILQEWVVVTHVENPTHFYVRHVAEQKAGTLLSKKITTLCSGARSLFTSSDHIKIDSLVFMRWKETLWCRAVVCELYQRGHLESVTVCPVSEVARLRGFFQDYGFTQGLTLSGSGDCVCLNESLRKADVAVQSEMSRWAPQAIKCALKDIIPTDMAKGWSPEACKEFRRVIGRSAVEMQVFDQESDILLVDLRKAPMDQSTGSMPLSLREYLVYMELAKFYSPVATHVGWKPLQFCPPVYPKPNVETNAIVSHINTPGDFYIQLVDNTEFFLLNSKLQDCYGWAGIEGAGHQLHTPVQDQACVALYDDKLWYRAQVTGFPGEQMVEVQFVDFGNKKTLPVEGLRHIKDEFFALPAMAVRCCLAGLLSLEETWNRESIERFRSLTEQKLVTAVTSEFLPHTNALPVYLYDVTDSTKQPVSIADIMVKEGLAVQGKQSPLEAPLAPHTDVWDPPFDQGSLTTDELAPPPADPPEQCFSLTLPACLRDLPVRVTHVISPGSIYVQLLQSDAQLKRLHDLLKTEFNKSKPQEVEWEADMFCAACISGVWERGKLCSVSSTDIAEVLRCDFGNKVNVHISNLRPLPPDLIGSLFLECCLSDVRPAGGGSTWTATACDFVSFYLEGAMAVMTLKERPPADPMFAKPVPVSLYCPNRAGQDVSMADILVSEGLALRERTARYVCVVKPPLSDSAETLPEMGEAPADVEENTAEKRREEGLAPAPVTVPPKPAPRTTPPPERVRTQAYAPPEMPHCTQTVVTVSAVTDDGIIYTMTPQAEREFERLQERLQQHIKSLPKPKHYSWRSVLGCAVMGPDMLWYRGQVQEVIGGQVKVQYVDQGLVENIPVCHVYPMVLCGDVPQLCVPCQLSGVTPVGRVWQRDAVALMKELLLNRSVNIHITELPEEPRGLVSVDINVDEMPLSRIMVHHQHAVFNSGHTDQDYVVKPSVPDLDYWDLNTEGMNDLAPVLGVYTEPKLPDKGKHFRVRIKHIRTPNEVFLCLLDKTACEQEEAESLEEALRRVNEEVNTLPRLTDFPLEGPCLAEYSDGQYYRAKLVGFSTVSPDVQILVRHVDFGSDDTLPPHRLRQLPASLLRFPCAAVSVRLAGFKPPRVCLEEERLSYRPEWSMRAMMEMIDLLHGNLSAVTTATEPRLTVFLYNADGSLVHVPLVEKGLADYE
ncbi:RING finger protein 17 [Chanos chanos]|uniref:RING finger protein 17 n=1 Tax=Chanos chanos TaxID=29144 RepID=A0A6J2WDJ7_CHACN|nr:RING finger protein 17 [Chanos chanos]